MIVSFIIGVIVTIAEPDLKVMADQVISIPSSIMILTISVGVGVSLLISSLRSIYGWNLSKLLFIGYAIVLILLFFVPMDLISIAFDAGGATGGTLTATFLLPITIGICIATNSNISTNAFGLAALISLAPLITIQIVGILYKYKTIQIVHIDGLDNSIIDF